jgi:hypothetical protein
VHSFLNQDYTEEDEEDEFKVFLFISSSSVSSWFQKKNEQLRIIKGEVIIRAFLKKLNTRSITIWATDIKRDISQYQGVIFLAPIEAESL